jgi:hypothetical protein
VICAVSAFPPVAQAADQLVVHLDQARITKLPDRVSTIVIGNPLIADAALQAGGLMVLTGKGYGMTNLVALDRQGAVLAEYSVQVRGAVDTVVVYRGDTRQSYSCTPNCEPRITLGDTPEYFEAVIGQTGVRNGRALGIGSGAAAGQGGQAPAR